MLSAKAANAPTVASAEGDMEKLRKDLSETAEAPPAARTEGGPDEMRAGLEREMRGLKARSEDQAGEIARLRAALSAFEQYDSNAAGSLRDSKVALKARLGSAQAQADQQTSTITRLRAELAAAHERLGRQAAHFMDEMRRIGAGAVPTSGLARRPQRAGERRGLAERVSQVRPVAKLEADLVATASAAAQGDAVSAGRADAGSSGGNGTHGNGNGAAAAEKGTEKTVVSGKPAAETPKAAKISGERRRPRLLDRITSLAKD